MTGTHTNLLPVYVKAWHESAESIIGLLPTLTEDDWSRDTDCPGWTVKDVAAHLAHLEYELATGETLEADPTMKVMISSYTQAGVDLRTDRTAAELQAEFTEAVAARNEGLAALPTDPSERAARTPGGIDWSWDTLLRNRSIDVWVHEQDVRRAVDRPGGMNSAGAQVTATTFRMAMPFVIGKKVRPAPGTSVAWHVTGEVPFDLFVAVGEDGRAQAVDAIDAEPQVALSMTTEEFTILGAGRRSADQLDVRVKGDRGLAEAVLAAMPVTF